MTDEELLRRWKNRALSRPAMLQVLAELNGVCTECMRFRLNNLGVTVGNKTAKTATLPKVSVPDEVFCAIRYYRNYLTDLTSEEKIQSNSKMMKEIRNHIKKLDMFVKG